MYYRYGHPWSEERLVRVGRWLGGIALVIGTMFAPIAMRWTSIIGLAAWNVMAVVGLTETTICCIARLRGSTVT